MTKIVKKVALVVALIIISVCVHAQITVTGTVTDQTGETMPGVNIIIKGTSVGIVTDINGKYSIPAPSNESVLVFSFVGFNTVEQMVGDRRLINVQLEEAAQALDEVVVIGYGTMRRRDVTGAITQMRAEMVANEAPRDVRDMLRANVAGLSISYSTSAKPGGDMELRGRSTMSTEAARRAPLLVVDGVIYTGGLEDINPTDIETMDILKDASSAAVYGAKSAMGVIVINTRKGKLGKPRINVNANIGLETMSVHQPVYDGKGFLQWRSDLQKVRYGQQAAANPGRYDDPRKLPAGVTEAQWLSYDNNDGDVMRTWFRRLEMMDNEIENALVGKETDWYSAVFRKGKRQDYNVSVSGKKEDITYYWSLGYAKNENLHVGEDYSVIRSRLNVDTDVSKFLTLGASAQFSYRDESNLFWDSGGRNQRNVPNWEEGIRTASPWGDMYNPDGTYRRRPQGEDSETTNPFYEPSHNFRDRSYTVLNSILYAKITLPFNITFQSTFSPNFRFHNYQNHQSSTHADWAGFGGRVRLESERVYRWQVDNLLKWNQTFGIHAFDVTLLQNAEKYTSMWSMGQGENFSPNDLLGYNFINSAASRIAENENQVDTGAAYMARLYYTLMDKYTLTATYRRDGYSAFGQKHPWADFSSFALAWRFTEENFWNSSLRSVLEYGKLRLSYGSNGNRDIGRYQALANMDTGNKYYYMDISTGNLYSNAVMFVSRMNNKDLRWENKGSFNVGLDFTFRRQIVDGSIDVYTETTTDLLMERRLPDVTGFERVMANLGQLQNRGIELTLNTTNIRRENLNWRTSFTFWYNKNQIMKLYGDKIDGKEADDPDNGWFIGKPISVQWQLKPKGVWQIGEDTEAAKYGAVPGDFRIEKKVEPTDGRYALTNDDKEFLGQTDPKFRITLRNEFTFLKNFSFSFMMYSNLGHIKEYNFPKNTRTSMQRRTDYVIPYWTPDNPLNTHARLFSRDPAVFNIYWDNSFIRLENVSLAYNVPSNILQKAAIQNLRLVFTIRNAAVWAPKWEHWDPERNGPTPRTFTFGLNMSL